MSFCSIYLMPALAIVGMALLGAIAVLLLVLWLYRYSKAYYSPDASHITISDKAFLELIADQNDGLLPVEKAIKLTGMTKAETKKRFTILTQKGLLKAGYTSSFKYYYSLKQPLKKGPYPVLSSDPFLTIGDLMILFKFFDYRLSIQDICLATNLPVTVIANEMKVFIKEKIVAELYHTSADGMTSNKFYILQGEYRDDPDKYLELQKEIDLDLSKLYAAHTQAQDDKVRKPT